jgi:3-hydroxybutyryl-CoA dehydrogenase
MGGGIAQVAATAGLSVTLLDVSDAIVGKGIDKITGALGRLVAKGTLTSQAKDAALSLLKTSTQFENMRDADIIVEAATENFELKSKIIKQVEAAARADAIIATNTSSLSVTRLASLVATPERFVGMHFFNPVPAMRLVEVVRGLQTSDQTVETVSALAKQLGKSPIVVKNMPGFVVNRILLPMINEAFFVLEQGEPTPEEIDEGMKLGCNHPMGPLALADLIGLDVVLAITEVLHREFGDPKYRPSQRLKELVDAGYLGRKTGHGVYAY